MHCWERSSSIPSKTPVPLHPWGWMGTPGQATKCPLGRMLLGSGELAGCSPVPAAAPAPAALGLEEPRFPTERSRVR